MYRIEDRSDAIKRVQRYLSLIFNEAFIHESGVFDVKTRLAVEDFQKAKGLAVSGSVNYETFESLIDEYRRLLTARQTRNAEEGYLSFPIGPKSSADEIKHVNGKMQDLLDYYGAETKFYVYSVFNEDVERSVKRLREIFLLPGPAVIDEELYSRIRDEHALISKKKR